MEDDLEGLSVGCHDDEVGQSTVQGLGGLIGSLLQLYHLTKKQLAVCTSRERDLPILACQISLE